MTHLSGPSVAQDLGPLLPGVTFAPKAWDLTTLVDGQIRALHFSEGQQVSQGDILVELDATDARLQTQLAEIKLRRAQAALAQQEDDLGRQKELASRQAVSTVALRDAEFAYASVALDVEQAEAELLIAREAERHHTIAAPADGLISAPAIAVGASYNPALSGSIARIVQLDPIHVRISVRPEDVVERLVEGSYTLEDARQLRFEMVGPNGGVFEELGVPVAVGFEIDPETGEGSVIVEFPNPNGLLRPGLPVHLRVRN
ncbi:efflux RND transporter periplasmic adaptor subunit [Palleronia sp. KMU-117]|uniref:efflux RND transporter periplasmic adaptor subunit n=1 Tax=Palleronia sp. KMU-117 TaxID=3434108 RepID=UPI003D741727